MVSIKTLEELRKKYKTSVKPDVENGALRDHSRYELAYICMQVMGLGKEITEFHSGIGLLADANMVYSAILQQKEPQRAFLNNLEVSLAQVKLSIETGNK